MIGANVSIKDIYKSYKDVKVLNAVNLEIKQGDFITILGPSGAGKTTLLKMIAGFESPNEGSIIVNGEDILAKPVHKRNIGMLFQNYALFPHMTVAENIAYPLKIRKVPKAEIKQRVDEMLKYIQLDGYGDRYPKQLSGGQQQRVALGRAIVFHPTVLLLDEPLGALDKQLRKQMQLEIKRIHDEMGLTTISVTHDQEEALTMSTRVCIMQNGMIAQIDTPEKIYSQPRNRFIASFIGEANIIPVKVLGKEKPYRTVDFLGQSISIRSTSFYIEPGMEVEAVIRPEKLSIVKDDYAGAKWKVTITQMVYAGDIWKIDMVTEQGVKLTMKTFTLADTNVSVGQNIYVSFSENDVVLINR